jgi:hypothetical protein
MNKNTYQSVGEYQTVIPRDSTQCLRRLLNINIVQSPTIRSNTWISTLQKCRYVATRRKTLSGNLVITCRVFLVAAAGGGFGSLGEVGKGYFGGDRGDFGDKGNSGDEGGP